MRICNDIAGLLLSKMMLSVCLVFIYFTSSLSASDKFKNTFQWEEIAQIPPGSGSDVQHGFASPFAGYHQGKILVAGGCNFPDEPVYRNGTKRYYDDIFVLDVQRNEWTTSSKFPYPVAYGASVTIASGVVCIGGRTQDSSYSSVYVLAWNDKSQEVEIKRWPELP